MLGGEVGRSICISGADQYEWRNGEKSIPYRLVSPNIDKSVIDRVFRHGNNSRLQV
jgi:hypothetical protein